MKNNPKTVVFFVLAASFVSVNKMDMCVYLWLFMNIVSIYIYMMYSMIFILSFFALSRYQNFNKLF